MSSTFLDLATDAMTAIGQLGVGQTISPEEAQQAMRVGNRMLAKWSLDRLMLFVINTRPFTMTIGLQDYTLGPTGVPFVGVRPVYVEAAQAVVLGSTMELPMNMLTKIQWGAIRDKGVTTSGGGTPGVSSDIWIEYTYPNLALHLWPVPGNPFVLKLGTWEELQQFATIFDVVNFPPGYEDPIVDNLAMELAKYFDMPVSQDLAGVAADGLLKIKGLNIKNLGGAFGEARTLQSPNLDQPTPAAPAGPGQ